MSDLIPETRALEARKRLEVWRRILTRTSAIFEENSEHLLTELLGSASVATMAEIESFLRDLVESIIDSINSEECSVKSLRPELRILHAHTTFDSIKSIGLGHRDYWKKRLEATELHSSEDIAVLPQAHPQPPLRGETVTTRTISDVSSTFNFPQRSELTHNAQRNTALKKLVGYRNSFAHAEAPPSDIFTNPKREVENLLKYIDHVSNLIDLLSENWRMVIEHKLYLLSDFRQTITSLEFDETSHSEL